MFFFTKFKKKMDQPFSYRRHYSEQQQVYDKCVENNFFKDPDPVSDWHTIMHVYPLIVFTYIE